jgi:sialic acid synthase SpsE
MTVTIICEIGSSPAPAWDFDAWCAGGAAAGATAVKAQCFLARHFPEAERESKFPLEFPRHRLDEFVNIAHGYGLQAGVSVFDEDAARLAWRDCDFLKLAAREQANHGLSSLAYALCLKASMPLYRSVSDLDFVNGLDGITPMYTVQSYPLRMHAAVVAVLRAALYFRRRQMPWGWSSHTRGFGDVLLAVYLGATVIEKHLTINPTLDIEAGHSLTTEQFRRMSSAIRKLERN